MTWSSRLSVPPAQPVDPGLAASAAALLSALVREEPRPLSPGGGQAPAVPPQIRSSSAVPADHDALPSEQARRRGVFGRR